MEQLSCFPTTLLQTHIRYKRYPICKKITSSYQPLTKADFSKQRHFSKHHLKLFPQITLHSKGTNIIIRLNIPNELSEFQGEAIFPQKLVNSQVRLSQRTESTKTMWLIWQHILLSDIRWQRCQDGFDPRPSHRPLHLTQSHDKAMAQWLLTYLPR